MILAAQIAAVVAALIIGARWGSVGIGFAGGAGVLLLGAMGTPVTAEDIPFDVIGIIMAVIAAISASVAIRDSPLQYNRGSRDGPAQGASRAAFHPDSQVSLHHRRFRNPTGSTPRRGGRGLSPPVRILTDPGARSLTSLTPQCPTYSPRPSHTVIRAPVAPAAPAPARDYGTSAADPLDAARGPAARRFLP